MMGQIRVVVAMGGSLGQRQSVGGVDVRVREGGIQNDPNFVAY